MNENIFIPHITASPEPAASSKKKFKNFMAAFHVRRCLEQAGILPMKGLDMILSE